MGFISGVMGGKLVINGNEYIITGASFNPNIEDIETSLEIGSEFQNGSSLNLGSVSYGHEVIAAIGKWDDTETHVIKFRKGTTTLFQYSSEFEWMYTYMGIDHDEIMENGTDYHVDFGRYAYVDLAEGLTVYSSNRRDLFVSDNYYTNSSIGDPISFEHWNHDYSVNMGEFSYTITGKRTSGSDNILEINTDTHNDGSASVNGDHIYVGLNVEHTLDFEVTNVNISPEADAGMIWVEGETIAFTCATVSDTRGHKHLISHDGTVYSSGKTPGMIRIGETDHGKIFYIDENGDERRTHRGDPEGTPGGNERNITGATPGMIWASVIGGNYGYLTFIGDDGKGYRIMNGSIF